MSDHNHSTAGMVKSDYHLGPTGDQDTHYDNWGLANQQRTAVLATANTHAAIMEALKAGRTYASEDLNVNVSFTVTYNMTDTITVQVGTQVGFDASLVDPDSETILEIELLKGTVGGATVGAQSTVGGNSLIVAYIPTTVGKEFFLIRATEADTQRVGTPPIWLEVTQ